MILSPMQPLPQYASMMTGFDIGLVPLSFIDFNEAKSFLKGIEYAASGIPFVAAGTGEYRLLAQSGVGRVASTPDEWVTHMTDLLDYATRKREAHRNLRAVERDHMIQSRAKDWVTVLAELRDARLDVPTHRLPYRAITV